MIWKKSPEELERWYRRDPEAFRSAFDQAPADAPQAPTWAARLAADFAAVRVNGFPFAIAASFVISAVFLIPHWGGRGMDVEWAAPLFATLAFGPLLGFHGLRNVKLLAFTGVLAIAVAWMWWAWDELPSSFRVQSWVEREEGREGAGQRLDFARQARDLMMIHWPMLLVGLTGWAYTAVNRTEERVDFVRHAVQVAILTALVLAAGGALLGLTNLLMETLDLSRYWVEEINIHLVTWGLSGALVFGHAVWLRHPHSLGRILPTLARIFIPLFVLVEAGFLSVQLWAGFDELSSNREQLFVFNLLLAAVIGLVLLHSAFDEGAPRWTHRLMVALVVLGALADLVGIAAIGSRLGAWGVTPNRLTVLVGNLLFLTTLVALLVAWFRGKSSDSSPHVATRRVLNRALAGFVIWAFCVTLLFPLYFGLQVKAEDLSHFEQDLVETLEVE